MLGFGSLLDTDFFRHSIASAQSCRWLTVDEIVTLLTPGQSMPLHITRRPPEIPPRSGTLLLFDRTATRDYKQDGHEWVKKQNSNKIREDHVKLLYDGKFCVAGTYVHCSKRATMHRRAYHLIDERGISVRKMQELGQSSLVLVHYLDTDADTAEAAMSMETQTSRHAAPQTGELEKLYLSSTHQGVLTRSLKNCNQLFPDSRGSVTGQQNVSQGEKRMAKCAMPISAVAQTMHETVDAISDTRQSSVGRQTLYPELSASFNQEQQGTSGSSAQQSSELMKADHVQVDSTATSAASASQRGGCWAERPFQTFSVRHITAGEHQYGELTHSSEAPFGNSCSSQQQHVPLSERHPSQSDPAPEDDGNWHAFHERSNKKQRVGDSYPPMTNTSSEATTAMPSYGAAPEDFVGTNLRRAPSRATAFNYVADLPKLVDFTPAKGRIGEDSQIVFSLSSPSQKYWSDHHYAQEYAAFASVYADSSNCIQIWSCCLTPLQKITPFSFKCDHLPSNLGVPGTWKVILLRVLIPSDSIDTSNAVLEQDAGALLQKLMNTGVYGTRSPKANSAVRVCLHNQGVGASVEAISQFGASDYLLLPSSHEQNGQKIHPASNSFCFSE
jgi:hypothetical protein